MSVVRVDIPGKEYNIHIEDGLIENIGSYIKKYYTGNLISIITDENVASYYKSIVEENLKVKGFKTQTLIVKAGESSKSISTFEKLQESLAESGHQRTDLILALGGGVVGDLAGFVSASYLRGVPFIQVPTSLLSQIDSSVGGKTGINLNAGKNLVGAIYQPKAVLIDPLVLDTLPHKYLRDGIGEAIKYGYIDRPELLDLFEIQEENKVDPFEHVLQYRVKLIKICCESKRSFVIDDEFDFGKRMILNFGHTIGHAIEKQFNYKKYTHGEAVAMGMYYMTKLSETTKLTSGGQLDQVEKLLRTYGLLNFDMTPMPDLWASIISKDKKNLNDSLNIILVNKPGEPIIHKTTVDAFHQLMKEVLV